MPSELWGRGRFPFDRLVKTYELSEINQVAHDSESAKVIKPVLRMPASGAPHRKR